MCNEQVGPYKFINKVKSTPSILILRVAIHILNESREQLMGSIGIFEQSMLPF